jgi:hypothetical protein
MVRPILLTILLLVAAVLVGGVAAAGWCAWHRMWLAAVQLSVSDAVLLAVGSILTLGLAANE